jgi:hypothetical protein
MNIAETATTISGVAGVVYIIMTLIDRWDKIAQWGGPMLSKISLVILIIGVISAGVAGIAYYTSWGSLEVAHFPKDHKFIEIKNKKFVNEYVLLDGHSYEYCDFTNVSFGWNGTAPFHLNHNSIHGAWIKTESDIVYSTILLLKGLDMFKEEIGRAHV